jgi:DNA mismatch repair protein MutL
LPIQRLAPDLVAKIAAGEVIERPASVVKELLENALDAGATQVGIEITQGGLGIIRVSDNGCGIPKDELSLAFERHATSKLLSESDLARVASLGFRGEALPSIAAVADVEIVSRPVEASGGAYLKVQDGAVVASGPRGAPLGTTVAAQGLFRRQPARLKFLRSALSEAGQIAAVVSHYALAYAEVAITLRLDGRLSLQTPGSGGRREAVAAVYGVPVASAMLPLPDPEGDDYANVSGLVSPPGLTRANRTYISLFINRRWVRSRTLTFAVEEAYRGLLMSGRFPIAVLEISLPPEEVDVNVHPTKAEVRLRCEREVFTILQRHVRRALIDQAPAAQAGLSAWTAPGAAPRPAPTVPPTHDRYLVSSRPSDRRAAPAGGGKPEAMAPLLSRLPLLRAVGQVGATYIVAEGPEGMYLIDQHAAHERILYERLLSKPAGPAEVQGFLQPVTVDLAPHQEQALRASAEALAEQGFSLEPFGGRTYLLRAAPVLLASGRGGSTSGGGQDVGRALLELLDIVAREDGPNEPRERVAASLACHAAIRAGQTLNQEEMRELVKQLEETQMPATCPHGRPTMIHLSAEALAKEFKRR